jgi:hypothetical protein
MYSEEKKNVLCKTEKTILLRNINVGFLGERDKTILMEIGLPGSAAPYISFSGEEEFGGYSLRDRISKFEGVPEEDIDAEDAVLDNTCVLGQCGMGYIVINKRGEIWVLDFDSFDEYYANRSLDDFLDCLYEYKMFVTRIHEKYGQGFIEDLMTESDLEVFEKTLRSIDKEILDEDNYWWEEIQSMREYKR